ncbi:hydroxymethylglutaryl-CoA lyase [Colletotrichum limetticola]|uniref:hydroxymethylglutaryl-CoA lyase n=1 Tax=Colletotrichum limetticola TaxID=1209924 RepID=A0ABQ9P9P1_9PEZI|nr:hydroxymethylglutaryl-CoA lyase [Colletotrichum limetticola]
MTLTTIARSLGSHTTGKCAIRRLFSSWSRNQCRIVEVGPRDGLQNIGPLVPTATKVELIKRLADTGLRDIEATSFVSPKWVPQLADGADVLKSLGSQTRGIRHPVLAPNLKGLERASAAGAKEIVVFASVTEAFNRANQGCTVAEALDQAEQVTKKALQMGIKVRGSVTSCIFEDPSSGPTPPEAVLPIVQRFLDMGCYEVGLGDTLGTGTPRDTQLLLEALLRRVPAERLAGHFHDTYGQGIANVVRAYDMGIRTFDSSVSGLGGCPYAPGARGNVTTEDVVYTLEKMGVNTGVDLDKLITVGQWISKQLGRPYGSRVGTAIAAKRVSAQAKDISRNRISWEVVDDLGEYRVSRAGAALKATLSKPGNGNALTSGMLEGLTKLFRDLANDPSVYHVVIESEGKYFCTGMDLSGGTETSTISPESSYYNKVLALYDAIDHAPQTTIALIDGPCFGGGVGLGFACDVRLASPRARWTLSEIKIGVSPAIISKYLVREWGPSVAREAMISGRELKPEELFRIGALHSVTEDLESTLDEYLKQLDRCAPRSAAINKELTRLGWYNPESEEQARLIENTFGNMMAPGSEGEHGIRKFQEKAKEFSWKSFWKGRSPQSGLDFVDNSPRKSS